MKNKFYCVFDLSPTNRAEEIFLKTFQLEKLGQFETEFEALSFIDAQEQGYGLTILPVWE